MFTVKVITETISAGKPNVMNEELLFEATQVRVCEGKIYCDTDDSGQIQYDQRPVENPTDYSQRMYVMNRQGATVATYYM